MIHYSIPKRGLASLRATSCHLVNVQNYQEISFNGKDGSPSVQHISSTQKSHSFSAPKSLSFTPKTPQFQTNLSVPHTPSVSHKKFSLVA